MGKQRRKYGTGSITRKGYIRFGSNEFEHRRGWKQHYGSIPKGMFIHHKNGDKKDNRIENLELVDATTHKRLHSGCIWKKDGWWKPCSICGTIKRVDDENWYFTREGWISYNRCKKCHIQIVVETKRRKKL